MFIPNHALPFLMFNDGGGDGGGAAADGGGAAAGAGEGAAVAAGGDAGTAGAAGAATAGAEATTAPWGAAENFDADKAATLIQNLRNEAATNKAGFETKLTEAATTAATKAKEELTRSLGEALGLIQPEGEADPAMLLESLQTEHTSTKAERDDYAAKNRTLSVTNTVLLRSGELNANAGALLDSREIEAKLAAIDPTADDYASQVDAVITAAVDTDPQRFRNTQAAAHRSGGDLNAGNANGGDQLTIEEFRALPAAERLKAHKEGRTRAFANG